MSRSSPGCVTTVDEWNGIELLFESDLMDLRADDEDLGDMDDENLEEWDDMDEADMLLPGCTPERSRSSSRHRASPRSGSAASQSRASAQFEISSPLKKKFSPVGGTDGKRKLGRAPSPLVNQTSRSSPPLALTPPPRPASAGAQRAPSPVTSRRQGPSSRPGSRITASPLGFASRRTPVPTKLTMRISSEGTALQAAVVAGSVKRSASPFVKQGSGGSSVGVEALKNINKMVNRSAAQSRAKQRSSSRGNGSRSATPTPTPGACSRSITPGPEASGAEARADGALVSFGVPPAEGGQCADEARPKPQRFRQFGALGGGGTLVAMPSPSLPAPSLPSPGLPAPGLPSPGAAPAEAQSCNAFAPIPPSGFFAPAGAPAHAAASPSPRASLDAGASGSGADAAPAAEAAGCGASGGVALGGGRINFKVSSGALLRPAPMAAQGGTATLKPTPLLPGAASFSISGRGVTSSLPPTGLPPTGLPPTGLPRSGGMTVKTVPTGGLTIKPVPTGGLTIKTVASIGKPS